MDRTGYYEEVEATLFAGTDPEAYVIWPATTFAAEAAVSIVADGHAYFARFASIEEAIFYRRLNAQAQKPTASPPISIAKERLPQDFAKRIVKVWNAVLVRTHPEEKVSNVTDGVGYVFFADGASGEDANLDCGVGDLMNASAVKLADLAQIPDGGKRHAIQKEIEKILTRIESNDYDRVSKRVSPLASDSDGVRQ